jgi:hypothetical protein
VRATTAEILAAIKTYWPGDIPIVDPSNLLSSMVDKQ